MIGRLLGHSALQATERYAHLDRDWVREAAVRISESIAADVLTGYPGQHGQLLADAPRVRAGEEAGVETSSSVAWFRARSSRAA